MTVEVTTFEATSIIQKYYPDMLSPSTADYFIPKNPSPAVKLQQGNLTTVDIERILKDPYSLQSQFLAISIMQAVVAQEIIKIKAHIADQEAQKETQATGHAIKERPDADLIKESDIQYAKHLLHQIENKFDTSTQEADLLKDLFKELDEVNNTLEPIEKEYREGFNQLLHVKYKDYFTQEEKETYTLTQEKQDNIHRDFATTKQNFEKLAEMIRTNPEMAGQPVPDFKQGAVPQLEIKLFRSTAGIDPESQENIKPSQIQKFSKAPEMFSHILKYENAHYDRYQKKQDLEEKIETHVKSYGNSTQDTSKALALFNIINQPDAFKSLAENIDSSDTLKTLTDIHESAGSARFEYLMNKKLQALPPSEQKALEEGIGKMLENHNAQSSSTNDMLISLKGLLEDINPKPDATYSTPEPSFRK